MTPPGRSSGWIAGIGPDLRAVQPVSASWAPGHTDFRFIRYRVTFDIAVVGELSTTTPRPVLDFIRFPFRF